MIEIKHYITIFSLLAGSSKICDLLMPNVAILLSKRLCADFVGEGFSLPLKNYKGIVAGRVTSTSPTEICASGPSRTSVLTSFAGRRGGEPYGDCANWREGKPLPYGYCSDLRTVEDSCPYGFMRSHFAIKNSMCRVARRGFCCACAIKTSVTSA